MKIQAIRENSIALFTDIEELNSRGIHAGCLKDKNTIEMIRQSFSQLGLASDGAIDVDAYINGDTVLIFARLFECCGRVCALFRFETLENLICACHAMACRPPATLMSHDGGYYLAIHGGDDKLDAQLITEYGDIQPHPEFRYAYLSEHGKIICRGNALQILCEAFHLNHSENPFFADSLPPCD